MRINLTSPFMNFISKCVDCFLITVYFFCASIPVITIGASITATSAAMLALCNDRTSSVTKTFWKSFCRDFRQATLTWLWILPLILLLVFDIWYCIQQAEQDSLYLSLLLGVSICVAIVLACFSVYVFAIIAQFETKLRQAYNNALQLMRRNLISTLLLVFLAVIMILLFYFCNITVLPLFSICMYCQAVILRKVFQPYMNPNEQTT